MVHFFSSEPVLVRIVLSHAKQFLKSKVFCNYKDRSERAIMLNNIFLMEIA